jgi:putative N6-adenine-specific DNA methylase
MKLSEEFDITVKTMQHLEEVLAAEMHALGIRDIRIGRRAVYCRGNLRDVYRMNLHLRTALRVLVPIFESSIRSADDIHRAAMKHDWTQYFGISQTFAIDPNVRSEFIRHSNYASVKLKDAIADTFRNKFGTRPNVHPESPDVLFNLHIDEHRMTISIDSSGDSLNRRGYRNRGAQAPLNEVLAAGMILLSGWHGECDFYDPMCGSGTLAIEANMIAQNMPAGMLRNTFGFMKWNNYDRQLWQEVKKDALAGLKPLSCRIYASDADKWQLRAAKDNITNAGFEEDIELTQSDFFEKLPAGEKGILMMNPPYGERIDHENILLLYKNIGDHLKRSWPGFQAWIISSNEEAIKRIGLKPSKKFTLINGTLNCRFIRIELFAGKHADWKTQHQ